MSADTPLIVMLPGAYDSPGDFVEHGFDRIARTAGFDWLAHPTDLTAIADGRLVHQIHEDVIGPMRARGDARILLGGISIGGLTALTYADTYPDTVDGLVLIAPYPGNRMITQTIERAGGINRWVPGALETNEGELRGWRALKSLGRALPAGLWLSYGESDRFAPGHRLMAEALPADQVLRAPGGHDWPTWQTLWRGLVGAIGAQ